MSTERLTSREDDIKGYTILAFMLGVISLGIFSFIMGALYLFHLVQHLKLDY